MVKAPERLAPPQPDRPQPPRTPRRRRLLAAGLVGGLALGGGVAAAALGGGSEGKGSQKPGVSAPDRSKDKTGTTEPKTQKEIKTDVELINERIQAFFALSDEDFTTWFNTVDEEGKTNRFSAHRSISGSDFDFPYLDGHSNYLINSGEPTKIMHNDGETIVDLQENLSVIDFSTERAYANLYGMNLGVLEINPSKESSLSVVFLGLKFQENLGGYKVVVPIVTDAYDPSNPDLRSLDEFGVFSFASQLDGKNDMIGISGYEEELDISREGFRTKLKNSENEPLVVSLASVDSGVFNPDEIIPGVDFITPGFRSVLIDGLSQLLSGNKAVFEANIAAAAQEGYIITSNSPELPSFYTTNQLSTVKEYLTKASLVGKTTFLKGNTPFPTANVK